MAGKAGRRTYNKVGRAARNGARLDTARQGTAQRDNTGRQNEEGRTARARQVRWMGPKGKRRRVEGRALNSGTGVPLQSNPPIRSSRVVFAGLELFSSYYFFLRF